MNTILLVIFVVVALVILVLWLWRLADHRADRRKRTELLARQPDSPARFDPAMIRDLPEPAQRYFRFTIQPGTPLYTVADITMSGQFALGSRQGVPDYLPMSAEQTLACPTGFIWSMRAAKGLQRLSGSDTESWTRFWWLGLIPVARFGGTPDHSRSAFGRYAAEAVFWTPAALLPGPGVEWQALDDHSARVVIRHQDLEQVVDVTVAADGHPTEVRFQRWSNANPEKTHRLQPFGGTLSDFRDYGGFRLPAHVEAGNFFATEQYFPFFIADILHIDFPGHSREETTGPGA